mmetsp:Transcript_18199/g.33642  ORF Transcript_18199/g.33642 Transcript_18199/m.33642 type:complete len:424 (-) Transcript_18199:64-1335(-)
MEGVGSFPVIKASEICDRTLNPIRKVIETINIPKGAIPLSIGDPTVFGNLKTSNVVVDAVKQAVDDFANHGYKQSSGMECARQAVATRHSKISGRNLTADDVILASGCSGALEMAIKAVCGPGENILAPLPGFPLYETLTKSNGGEVKYYPLVPERSWEADIEAMDAAIDEKTRAIMVNNPSNPCGSVFSEQHLKDILAVAEKHKLPIISDEIYGNIIFEGHTFFPMAKLTSTVPILEVGGIAKEFMVPGFRLGWVIVHDSPSTNGETSTFSEIRKGLNKLSTLLVGPTTLVQAALPRILAPEPGSEDATALAKFQAESLSQLESNAKLVADRLCKIRGLKVVVPQGAMYVMIGIDTELASGEYKGINDVKFVQGLLDDELVFLLPGSCFGIENYMRIVFCAPAAVLEDSCNRIERFCAKVFA